MIGKILTAAMTTALLASCASAPAAPVTAPKVDRTDAPVAVEKAADRIDQPRLIGKQANGTDRPVLVYPSEENASLAYQIVAADEGPISLDTAKMLINLDVCIVRDKARVAVGGHNDERSLYRVVVLEGQAIGCSGNVWDDDVRFAH